MSYDKRDYRSPYADGGSDEEDSDEHGGGGEADHFNKYNDNFQTPTEWIENLKTDLIYLARNDAVEIFDQLTSSSLAEFLSYYDLANIYRGR